MGSPRTAVDLFPSEINGSPPSHDQELKDFDIAGGRHMSPLGDEVFSAIDQLPFDQTACPLFRNQKVLTFYLSRSNKMMPRVQGGAQGSFERYVLNISLLPKQNI